MASFTYDGLNRQGQSVHGEVVADNSTVAIDKLREAGVVVTDISEKVIKEKKAKGGKFSQPRESFSADGNGEER